ncbi:MAG: DUF4339 domain-containing protein, partial [Thermogutta sp.]|nr:DUF4339 domain-containing protein [Thermogutta sp.]
MGQQWYYAKGEQKIGPITAGELKRLAQNSELLPDDLVWREGLRDWMAAKRIRGLFPESEAAEAAPAAPSPAAQESVAQEALPGVPDEYSLAQPASPLSNSPAADPTKPASDPTKESQPLPRRPPPLSQTPSPPQDGRTDRLKAAFENSPTTFARSRESQGGHVFDAFLGLLRQFFGSEFINGTLRLFALCGQFGLWAGAAVAVIAGLSAGLRRSEFADVFAGIAFAAVLVILQYAAARLLFVLERWDRLVPAQLGSSAPTDGLSLMSLFVGITGLVLSTAIAFRSGTPNLLFVALGVFIVFTYLSLSMLNLEGMNISIVPETSPAEEALGLLQFFFKMILRITPVLFGTLILLGFFQLLVALILGFGEEREVAPGDFEQLGKALDRRLLEFAFQTSGRLFLILGGLFPVITYLFFVFGQLALALLASILAIPARL